MPLARRTLMEVAAERFGLSRAYTSTTAVDELLAEQTETAYARAAGHAVQATAKHDTGLAVQPGVLDVRGRILDDVLYLEGLLAGARNRGLAPGLTEFLEAAVDQGHALVLVLADTARATTAPAPSGI